MRALAAALALVIAASSAALAQDGGVRPPRARSETSAAGEPAQRRTRPPGREVQRDASGDPATGAPRAQGGEGGATPTRRSRPTSGDATDAPRARTRAAPAGEDASGAEAAPRGRTRATTGEAAPRARGAGASEDATDAPRGRTRATTGEAAPRARGAGASEDATDAPRGRGAGASEDATDAPRARSAGASEDATDAPRARPAARSVEAAPPQAVPPEAGAAGEPPSPAPPDAIPPDDAPEPAPPGQLLQSPDALDGGVPALDGALPPADASLEPPDAGWDAPPDAGPPDAGPPDAGRVALTEPDAGPPPAQAPPAADTPGRDFITALGEWWWERAGRESAERESAERAAAARDERPSAETPSEIEVILDQSLREWLGFALPERRMSAAALVVLLLLAMLGLWLVERTRRTLPERGVVPRLLGAAHLALRLVAVLIVLMLASRLLPAWLHPSLLLTIAAVAVALGFGAVWVLLPDLIGGIVLLTEGRLRPGQWIVGDGFAGVVEQVGPRVTLLRGPDGAIVTVPNRAIVRSAVRASDRRWHEVEVELRAPRGASAAALRAAIRDAVLSSPYIPPDPGLVLARDPRDPERWRLKVRLLDVRFGALFEGQLAERVEEALALLEDRPPGDGAP